MQPNIAFTPDDKVEVHQEGAIRLLCAAFRSHEDGLPEWIKNSSDAYTRMNVAPNESVIVVVLRDGPKGTPSIVGCLDFGGMTTSDIEDKFRKWANPNAAGNDAGVEGGHGNGGKCYMTQLFTEYAYIHSLKDGRANKYGFKGGSPIPGYFPSAANGRGYKVGNANDELIVALKSVGLSIHSLPQAAIAAWEIRKSFTLVFGVGAKHVVRGRIPYAKWVENLQGHQQTIRALQRAQVYVLHNSEPLTSASPLEPEIIEPIPGAELDRVIAVPVDLIDPNTGETIDTHAIQNVSRLVLRTSNVSMRFRLKSRHTINGWTHDGRATGYWEIPSLSRAGYANKIYGDLYLEQLYDYKQNDRRNHSDSPLTRAIKDWLATQVDVYSAEFAKLDEIQATKEEQDELSRQNEALNQWKNTFLKDEFGGAGDVDGTGGMDPPPRRALPRGKVDRVILSITHSMAGQGVTFQPRLEFFDTSGKRVRAVPHEWASTDWAVATADAALGTVTTHSPGTTKLSVVCAGAGVESNAVPVEVLDISKIELSPLSMEISARSRRPVDATVYTRDGRTLHGVYLIWTENDRSIVSLSSGGMVYGLVPGQTSVTAGDNQAEADGPTQIKVLTPEESGGDDNSGFPKILLSEIDDDPLGDGPPQFSSSDPPVHQRPQDVDANIWWINMGSPLARRYIDVAKGAGAKSREWRVYLIERYIEVMVKIALSYDFKHGDEPTFETMLRRWEEEATNMQQRAMESLAAFLDGGPIEGTT